MELFYIILLILLGLLFLVAEIVFLPGISIGGLLAMACYGGAIYLAFGDFGTVGGLLAVVVVLAVSIVATVVSLARQDVAALLAPAADPFVEHALAPRGAARGRSRHYPLAPLAHG